VKNVETGATRVATTDAAGAFRIPSLPLGPQEVRAEKTGFKAGVRTGIDLAVGQEAVVNLRLEVGELSQQVLVYAEAPLINTTTSSVSGLVEERQVKELPLNGRSFDNLITLNPGAINYSSMKSANTTTSDGNSFSVAGRLFEENNELRHEWVVEPERYLLSLGTSSRDLPLAIEIDVQGEDPYAAMEMNNPLDIFTQK